MAEVILAGIQFQIKLSQTAFNNNKNKYLARNIIIFTYIAYKLQHIYIDFLVLIASVDILHLMRQLSKQATYSIFSVYCYTVEFSINEFSNKVFDLTKSSIEP